VNNTDFEAGAWNSTIPGHVVAAGWQHRWMDMASDWADGRAGIFHFMREIDEDGSPHWFLKMTYGFPPQHARANPVKREPQEQEPVYTARVFTELKKIYASITRARHKTWTDAQEKEWLQAVGKSHG
jgi:hypothetical protein